MRLFGNVMIRVAVVVVIAVTFQLLFRQPPVAHPTTPALVFSPEEEQEDPIPQVTLDHEGASIIWMISQDQWVYEDECRTIRILPNY